MRVVFMGNPQFALPTLTALLSSQHDVVGIVSNPLKPMGRGRKLKSTAIGQFAKENDLNLLQSSTLKSDELHTQLSVLQSTISITDLVEATSEMNMPAVALTDNANMMGAFRFVSETQRYNRSIDDNQVGEGGIKRRIKPIVGCVFYVCEDHLNKNYRDNGYHVVFLAKNKNGYNNLTKFL